MREEDAGRIAAEHLLALGHMRLGHIAGPLDARHGAAPRRRVQRGRARRRPRAAGGRRGGVRRGVRLRGHGTSHGARTPPPTGVFISNLNQAIGALCGARRRGSACPTTCRSSATTTTRWPSSSRSPLTTIRMPLVELGVAAIGALADQIGGGGPFDLEIADDARARGARVDRSSLPGARHDDEDPCSRT